MKMNFIIILLILSAVFVLLNIYLIKSYLNLKLSNQKILLASKAKSLFMQKLAYEFRNPLNGIAGFSEMLEAGYFGELSPKQQERVHDIYTCGNQLQSLIKDLIDLSKGESGMVELIETGTNLSVIIDKAIDGLKTKISSNKIRILTDLEPIDCQIMGDQNKLVQVFRNIIDNAVKFSLKGGQVTIKQSSIQDKFLKICIADSGIGMNQDILDTLFLFPDDTKKTKSLNNGLGMGMPLAKLFIELHGGIIEVDSEDKIGTTIAILIPESRLKLC
ncbi:ATP-binding protein [Candidatus Jidaibacter acanthamoebae]